MTLDQLLLTLLVVVVAGVVWLADRHIEAASRARRVSKRLARVGAIRPGRWLGR